MSYIYVVQKTCINKGIVQYNRAPLAAGTTYDKAASCAKGWRDYILKYGNDPWFSEFRPEELIGWEQFHAYVVGSRNKETQIVFQIYSVPEIVNEVWQVWPD